MNYYERNSIIINHEDDELNNHLDEIKEPREEEICPRCGELKAWDEEICEDCQIEDELSNQKDTRYVREEIRDE